MDQTEEKYIRGFNNAYLLEEHEPALLASIMNGVELTTDYLVGMSEGRSEYQQERQRRELDGLAQLRENSSEQNREIRRE